MSDPPSFWAQKRNPIKSTESYTPTVVQPPNPADSSSTKNPVFKDMTNGAAKICTPHAREKVTDWADSDEDELFMASLTKLPRVITLENEVAQKDARIGELEAIVSIKSVRVSELEILVEEKGQSIATLEARVGEQVVQDEELNKKIDEQRHHLQELLSDVTEKNCGIEKLNVEFDVQDALIRDLEIEPDPQTQVSANVLGNEEKKPTGMCLAASQFTEPHSNAEPTEEKEDVSEDPSTTSANSAGAPQAITTQIESPRTANTQLATSGPLNESISFKVAPGQPFGDSDFPRFATRETIKVAPLYTVPKKLSFPIDFSKYGKKPVTTHKEVERQKKAKGVPNTYGLHSKQRHVKHDAVPNFNPSMDIRQMSHSERIIYANGPRITVKMGDVKLGTLPKYVLMQCSAKAYQHFTDQPEATNMVFPASSMDADAATAHLRWMDEMTYQGRVYSVTLNTDPMFDNKNLKICRAARVLDLNNTYVGHFTKQLCDRIRNNEASTEFIGLVCDLAYPENDPIFECLANKLVNESVRKAVKKPGELAAFLAKHDDLRERMEQIERRLTMKRKGYTTSH
ncbi:Nn.00g025650.m01.CDS01 [Neocucurbitaria sp. VM-36]